MTTWYERGWIVFGGLTIGSMAAVLVVYFPWHWPVSALALVLMGWATFGMGQVFVTDLYRRHSREMEAKWLEVSARYRQAVKWNRYIWTELSGIADQGFTGYNVAKAFLGDPPGPEAGGVIPPEGSAGGS